MAEVPSKKAACKTSARGHAAALVKWKIAIGIKVPSHIWHAARSSHAGIVQLTARMLEMTCLGFKNLFCLFGEKQDPTGIKTDSNLFVSCAAQMCSAFVNSLMYPLSECLPGNHVNLFGLLGEVNRRTKTKYQISALDLAV